MQQEITLFFMLGSHHPSMRVCCLLWHIRTLCSLGSRVSNGLYSSRNWILHYLRTSFYCFQTFLKQKYLTFSFKYNKSFVFLCNHHRSMCKKSHRRHVFYRLLSVCICCVYRLDDKGAKECCH